MNVSERAKEKIDVASKEIKDAVESLKQEVAELSSKVKEKLKGSGEELRESTEELSRETKKLSERIKELIPRRRSQSLPVRVERGPGGWGMLREWMPDLMTGEDFRADLSETDDEFRVSAELPGVDKDDISVSVSSGMITIQGEKRVEQEHKKSDYYSLERSYGAFSRSFRLPAEVTPEKAEASFKDGVLAVRMPKSEAARRRSRKIKIRSG